MPSPLLKEQIEQLLKIKTETKNLDYKKTLNWSDKDCKLGLVKDVLAMANTQDGGRIVVGVQDSDFSVVGLSEEEFLTFDQTKVNDFLQKYTDPKHSVQVHKFVRDDGKRIVVIDVPEFDEIPILCKTDAHSTKDGNKLLLQCGQIYTRTDKATSQAITSAQEMREFLGRAVAKTSDTLLASIERLIKGKTIVPQETAAEKYAKELGDAENFIEKRIGPHLLKYGHWKLRVYPQIYNPGRIKDQKTIAEMIAKAEVNLRGWNLPHTDTDGQASNFAHGRQSFTVWGGYVEAYKAYTSGCFAWSRTLWEDMEEKRTKDGNTILYFTNAIWSITEMLLFAKRYYEQFLDDEVLHLEITLVATNGRVLASPHPSIDLWGTYASAEATVPLIYDAPIESVRASFKDIAAILIKRLFTIFNWDDATEAMIDGWQTKLLERKL